MRDGHQAGLVVAQDAGDFSALDGMLELCRKAAFAAAENVEAYGEGSLPWVVTIRIGGEEEARLMNKEFRHKDYATNVLSFPNDAEPEEGDEDRYVGDIFICLPVVEKEAKEQGKRPEDHLMHMVVHGMLHLVGYDHEVEDMAAGMEALEADILAGLGVKNPYAEI